MKTVSMIRQEHLDAEAAILEILRKDPAPRSTREMLDHLYRSGRRFSSGTLRNAVWSLVEEKRVEFTPERRLRLKH